ncbi:MAG: hypothetical protein IT380_01405 [Myxococcales bacterium]|nr:hypothetical protein [Myxococcales bacterium]
MSDLSAMEQYLQGIPAGLASYPGQLQKASVVQQFMKEMPTYGLEGQVPAPLEGLLSKTLSPSSWVPEVHATALLLAVRGLVYSSDEAFLSAALRANRRLLTGPLYRMLMMVVSPGFLLKNAAGRWSQFHQGMTLSVSFRGEGEAVLQLEYPPGLLPHLIARAYSTAFHAAVEAAGGKAVAVELAALEATQARFTCKWG